MQETPADSYQALRGRIARWLERRGKHYRHAQILLLAPDLLHLLYKLVRDPRIPLSEKVKLTAAIAYFVAPIDLMPESFMGVAGYVDDVSIAAYVLNALVNAGYGAIAREHWAGQGELLDALQSVLSGGSALLGPDAWQRLRAQLEKRLRRS